MATCGEVPGRNHGRADSEDLDQLKCQPCLEDGHLQEAVGMCVNCDHYLCNNCFQGHTLPRPLRHHKLLDLEQKDQGTTRISTRDMCTEACQVHDDEITKYYCTNHRRLGCTVCVTLDHKTCETVHYIPHVAKELASNEEYVRAEKRLRSALNNFKTVSENATHTSDELESCCSEVVNSIREFRRSVDEALGKIETELIAKVEAIKSRQNKELATIKDKYRTTQGELHATWTKVESLLNSQQNCAAYINMMKAQERLEDLESLIDGSIMDASYKENQIRYTPNRDTLEKLMLPDVLGTVSESDKQTLPTKTHVQDVKTKTAPSREKVERLEHTRDLSVRTGTDTSVCYITASVIIPDDKLVIVDKNNLNIKTINVQSGQVLSQLKMSSKPWDVTAIGSSKVVVSLPHEKKLAIITVGDNAMNTDEILDVDGDCRGVDYRTDKLAVSFRRLCKVQVLSLKGTVLHTIINDTQGKPLFNAPDYLTYGQDDTILYVSNYQLGNVMCVKLDGTVVAKYTNDDKRWDPRQPVVDINGDVLVCAGESYNVFTGTSHSAVHQITGDCKKVRELLTKADGLANPRSICFNTKKDLIVDGMYNSDIVKVYKVERGSR